MHSTVNHKMHTPCCYRSLDVATPWLSIVLRTCRQHSWSHGMCATVDRSKMIKKCIHYQLSMFVPCRRCCLCCLSPHFFCHDQCRPCLIIIKQRSSLIRQKHVPHPDLDFGIHILHVTIKTDPFRRKHFCACKRSPLAGSPSTEPHASCLFCLGLEYKMEIEVPFSTFLF